MTNSPVDRPPLRLHPRHEVGRVWRQRRVDGQGSADAAAGAAAASVQLVVDRDARGDDARGRGGLVLVVRQGRVALTRIPEQRMILWSNEPYMDHNLPSRQRHVLLLLHELLPLALVLFLFGHVGKIDCVQP